MFKTSNFLKQIKPQFLLTAAATLMATASVAAPAQAQELFRWVPAANGHVPPHAVLGGEETNRNLYLCRANYQGGVHPGKLVANNCNIGWGGDEIRLPNYEVLTKVQTTWVPASNGYIPSGAILGGQEPGRQLYICRANYQGGRHPGKVVANYCNIGWGGSEIRLPNYEVFVAQ